MTPFEKPKPPWWSRRRVRHAAYILGLMIAGGVLTELIYNQGIARLFRDDAPLDTADNPPVEREIEGKPRPPHDEGDARVDDDPPFRPGPPESQIVPADREEEEEIVSPPPPPPVDTDSTMVVGESRPVHERDPLPEEGQPGERSSEAGERMSQKEVLSKGDPARRDGDSRFGEPRRVEVLPDDLSVTPLEIEPQVHHGETIRVTAGHFDPTPAVRLYSPRIPDPPRAFRNRLVGKRIRFQVLVRVDGRGLVKRFEAPDVPAWVVERYRISLESATWQPARDETGAEVDSLVTVGFSFR